MPNCHYCHAEYSERQISRHLKAHRDELANHPDVMDEDVLDISIDDGPAPYNTPSPVDDGPAPYNAPSPVDDGPAHQDNNPAVEAEDPPPGGMGDMDLGARIEEDIGKCLVVVIVDR
jgi:hypothetical protein